MSFSFTAGAETVITTDQGLRGGKIIELKAAADKAVAMCPRVKRVFVSQRTGANLPKGRLDIPFEEVSKHIAGDNVNCSFLFENLRTINLVLLFRNWPNTIKNVPQTSWKAKILCSCCTHQAAPENRKASFIPRRDICSTWQ